MRLYRSLIVFLWFAGISIMLGACEEEPPPVNLNPDTGLTDTSYMGEGNATPQEKKVLIEDFTGVRCNNCPDATDQAEAIKADNPDRIIILAIHCNDAFSEPYPESKEDYKTEKGTQLYDLFGQPSQPAGAIDRSNFDNQDDVILSYPEWPNFADQRLNIQTPVNLELNSELEGNEVSVLAKTRFLSNLAGNFYLTIAVTEDKIQDVQLMPSGEKKKDYEHNHILRKIITPFDGTLLYEAPEANRVVEKEFKAQLEDDWVKDSMNVVGFVHSKLDSTTVHQTNKVKLK